MKNVQADLDKIKAVLIEEYASTLGFMVEDPMFTGAVLYLRDSQKNCTTEDAVRILLPKPCVHCKSTIEHKCDFNQMVSTCVKRVNGLRIVKKRPEILRDFFRRDNVK